ncbi:glycerate dehydrogenase [Sporosarcina sp. NCCP-2222]|uniref:D-2-hydroxyacid dehydrogenase n=1 Tax=Sporosarcina sp. NCCP-2222 TaxID=2935073 RepID=UPI00208C2CCE|nr:D-2-hydroxyacid dehydrogenase [Sporosarcina sp. NCCP-2222]GKV57119.1 glycerate dehydrogenase [Sporosarcina sp. NCCP-2222]
MKAVFTFKIKDTQYEELIKQFPDVTFSISPSIKEAEVEHANIIVTYGEDIDETILDKATALEWIMVSSAGVEKMPLSEIAKRNIVVSNVKGIHKTPMAESVLAHILGLCRSLPAIYENQKRKEWNKKVHSVELNGSTAMIIGPGAIGSEIGRLLKAFGVKTIGCNRSGKPVESMDEIVEFSRLEEALPEADFVISVLPSTPETKGILTARHFDAMKSTAVFMNFGRGDLVKEKDILEALQSGKIGHAVLDVFEEEPLPQDSGLWELSNVTISPHISSHSRNYVPRALEIFKENLVKWQSGDRQLINLLDPEQGY